MANRNEYFALNQAYWNERVDTHVRSAFYDVESFRNGRSTLDERTTDFVRPVDGKTLLHLQCHFGMDTLSWARLGAEATGVDFSEAAIKQARKLSDEIGVPATFLESNIYELPERLDALYDVVFTSWGTIIWLPDIVGWAQVAARYVKPGGTFVFIDSHPATYTLDYRDAERLSIGFDYFQAEDAPDLSEEAASYADPDSQHVNTRSAEWNHTIGSILTALIEAGLRIEEVQEEEVIAWQYHPLMVQGDDGYWRLPEEYPKLPFTLKIRATKDA